MFFKVIYLIRWMEKRPEPKKAAIYPHLSLGGRCPGTIPMKDKKRGEGELAGVWSFCGAELAIYTVLVGQSFFCFQKSFDCEMGLSICACYCNDPITQG